MLVVAVQGLQQVCAVMGKALSVIFGCHAAIQQGFGVSLQHRRQMAEIEMPFQPERRQATETGLLFPCQARQFFDQHAQMGWQAGAGGKCGIGQIWRHCRIVVQRRG